MIPRRIITTLNLADIVSNVLFAVKNKSPVSGGFSYFIDTKGLPFLWKPLLRRS